MIMPLIFLFVLAVLLVFYYLMPKKSKAPNLEPDIELALKEKVSDIFDGKTDWKLVCATEDYGYIELYYNMTELLHLTIIANYDGWVDVNYVKNCGGELCFEDKSFYERARAILKEHNNERLKR